MNIITIKNDLLQSATYLFNCYLVDCGDSKKIIEELGETSLKGIFLTHCHQDHVFGIEQILQKYPDAKVYCSQKTLDGLKDPMLNLSYIMPNYDFVFNHEENVVILQEGTHQIDGILVEVISCIGHSEDCISFIIGDNIFTGDSHIPFTKVFTKWPTSNKQQALESELKILNIINNRNLKVYPGHWK